VEQEDKGTILDSSAFVEGKLEGNNITIKGRFKGDLQVSGVLQIVEGSHIEASIKAKRVVISGDFQGDLQTDSLQLLEQGRASGVFRASKLSVKEGAKLNGELEIGEPGRGDSPSGERPGSASS